MTTPPTIAPGALAELVAKWREYAALDQVEVRTAKRAIMPMTAVAYDNSATTYTNCANELESALASLLAAREVANDPPKELPQRILAKIEQYGGWTELLAFIERAEAGQAAPAAAEWRPIAELVRDSRVVLFCDERGNRWTQCAHSWDIPFCGLPAHWWQELPTPPSLRTGEGDGNG